MEGLSLTERQSLKKLARILSKNVWDITLFDVAFSDYDIFLKKHSVNSHFLVGIDSVICHINSLLEGTSGLYSVYLDITNNELSSFRLVNLPPRINSTYLDLFVRDIEKSIASLSYSDRIIFEARFGYNSDIKTLSELSKITRKAPSRIRQKEREICEHFKTNNRIPCSILSLFVDKTYSSSKSTEFESRFKNPTCFNRFRKIYYPSLIDHQVYIE